MLDIVPTKQFQKDLVKAHKRGKKLEKIELVIDTLAGEKPLAAKNKDHVLMGNYVNYRECHIEPDWLLIYKIEQEEQALLLIRTGTHADLF